MGFLDGVQRFLGIKPVRVSELEAAALLRRETEIHMRVRNRSRFLEDDLADIEIIPEYEKIRYLIEEGAPLVLVSGGAGTGKSTLVRYLKKKLLLSVVVGAPTGVAALTVGGVTLHSLFRFRPKVVTASNVRMLHGDGLELLRKLEVLIVDEVSMVRADVLDGIDASLRLNRESEQPFGGVRVLLIGDLFQLPPVADYEEQEVLREMGYASNFFFSSKALGSMEMLPVSLRRTFRQISPRFVEILQDLRRGIGVEEALCTINARHLEEPENRGLELVLTCTRAVAHGRNSEQLKRLEGPVKTYKGRFTGEFSLRGHKLPAPLKLELKKGAQVMFTKNDENKRWTNGTLGRVVSLGVHSVQVECENRTFEVVPVSWEQYKYEYDRELDRIVPIVASRYTQIPLMLAWAVTIHKAQGKTLSRVLIDLGRGAFATGQVYVALSRVRALADIRLSRPIRGEEVITDPAIQRFYRKVEDSVGVERKQGISRSYTLRRFDATE